MQVHGKRKVKRADKDLKKISSNYRSGQWSKRRKEDMMQMIEIRKCYCKKAGKWKEKIDLVKVWMAQIGENLSKRYVKASWKKVGKE
jgi:hypothetical protein